MSAKSPAAPLRAAPGGPGGSRSSVKRRIVDAQEKRRQDQGRQGFRRPREPPSPGDAGGLPAAVCASSALSGRAPEYRQPPRLVTRGSAPTRRRAGEPGRQGLESLAALSTQRPGSSPPRFSHGVGQSSVSSESTAGGPRDTSSRVSPGSAYWEATPSPAFRQDPPSDRGASRRSHASGCPCMQGGKGMGENAPPAFCDRSLPAYGLPGSSQFQHSRACRECLGCCDGCGRCECRGRCGRSDHREHCSKIYSGQERPERQAVRGSPHDQSNSSLYSPYFPYASPSYLACSSCSFCRSPRSGRSSADPRGEPRRCGVCGGALCTQAVGGCSSARRPKTAQAEDSRWSPKEPDLVRRADTFSFRLGGPPRLASGAELGHRRETRPVSRRICSATVSSQGTASSPSSGISAFPGLSQRAALALESAVLRKIRAIETPTDADYRRIFTSLYVSNPRLDRGGILALIESLAKRFVVARPYLLPHVVESYNSRDSMPEAQASPCNPAIQSAAESPAITEGQGSVQSSCVKPSAGALPEPGFQAEGSSNEALKSRKAAVELPAPSSQDDSCLLQGEIEPGLSERPAKDPAEVAQASSVAQPSSHPLLRLKQASDISSTMSLHSRALAETPFGSLVRPGRSGELASQRGSSRVVGQNTIPPETAPGIPRCSSVSSEEQKQFPSEERHATTGLSMARASHQSFHPSKGTPPISPKKPAKERSSLSSKSSISGRVGGISGHKGSTDQEFQSPFSSTSSSTAFSDGSLSAHLRDRGSVISFMASSSRDDGVEY